jgi:hypothetical protein
MASTGEGRRIKLWAAVVGGIAMILAIAMSFTQIVDVEGQIMERDGLTIIALHIDSLFIYLSAIFVMIGYILSWWYKLPTGILMILAGIYFIVIDFFPDSFLAPMPVTATETGAEAANEPAFVFGIPAFIAGLLFLWYWRVSKKST